MKKFFTRRSLLELGLTVGLCSAILYYMGRPPANAPSADQVQNFALQTLDGQSILSQNLVQPTILVFWATWCPPCKVELARLQRLVSGGSIPAKSVIAVSIGEEHSLVEKVAKERGYTFEVALDPSGEVASKYAIEGTPTVLLRNGDGTISWRTSGVSPTLELRVMKFVSK